MTTPPENAPKSHASAEGPEPALVTLARIEGVLQGHEYYCRTGQTSPELAQETIRALRVDIPALQTQLALLRAERDAVRAALNCDLPGNEDAETVARKMYHENTDLRTQLAQVEDTLNQAKQRIKELEAK